uniref:Uncharacterized protein n=1 Tax=Anopheles quadriannulatus TaxID=34691 RepID=A0A182XU57_ANOQN
MSSTRIICPQIARPLTSTGIQPYITYTA